MCEECKRKNDQLALKDEQINNKNEEIAYLKALIALESIRIDPKCDRKNITHVAIEQRCQLLQNQLLLIRADVQYLNREVQTVLQWTAKVITAFLSCCGRVGESTTALIVDSANKIS